MIIAEPLSDSDISAITHLRDTWLSAMIAAPIQIHVTFIVFLRVL